MNYGSEEMGSEKLKVKVRKWGAFDKDLQSRDLSGRLGGKWKVGCLEVGSIIQFKKMKDEIG